MKRFGRETKAWFVKHVRILVMVFGWLVTAGTTLGIVAGWLNSTYDAIGKHIDGKIDDARKELKSDIANAGKELKSEADRMATENEIKLDAISTYSVMDAAACSQNYEGVIVAYEELTNRHPIESIPVDLRVLLYREVLAALAHRGKYELMKEDQVNQIAAAIDTSGRKECLKPFLNLAICYVILKKPEEAKRRALHALRLLQSEPLPDDYSYLTVYKLLLIACLEDPQRATAKDKIESAMATLNECELTYIIPYPDMSYALAEESGLEIVHYLRINNPDVFGAAYDQLIQEIGKKQADMTEEQRADGLYVVLVLKQNGKSVTRSRKIREPTPTAPNKDSGPPKPGNPGDC